MFKKKSLLVTAALLASLSYSAVAEQKSTQPIVLINPFTVPVDKLEQTLAMWEAARDFLKQQPGYISTELHQSLAVDAQYRLINVAQWQSAQAFKAATKKMWAEASLPRIDGVKPHPALYRVIRKD